MADIDTKEEESSTSTPEETKPSKESTSEDSMLEKIESSVRKVLGKLLDSGQLTVEEKTTPTSPTEDKPPTRREEERTMEQLVEAAVAKLKSETPSESSKQEPPTPPAETQPQTTARKIEQKLWGIK